MPKRTPKPAVPPELPRAVNVRAHLTRIRAEIEAMKRKVASAMYADTIEEAAKLMDEMRNEQHVRNLRDVKVELEFLVKRAAQLDAELLQLATQPEVANG